MYFCNQQKINGASKQPTSCRHEKSKHGIRCKKDTAHQYKNKLQRSKNTCCYKVFHWQTFVHRIYLITHFDLLPFIVLTRQVVCDILRLDASNLRLIQYAFIEQHSIGSGNARLFLSKVRLIVAKRRWSVFMSEIIDQFYTPLLIGHGFIRDPDNQQYGALGDCWKLSPEVGEGTYWTYGQKDLYDIKIHNFSFHEDFMLECSMPECLSITRYDSISGEELSPYRRLSAGCIKTFIGGYAPYKALIHKNIPIRSVGIEIAPAYYEDYLKKLYPEAQINPVDAFRKIDQTSDFPEMSRLLTEIKDYRGEGIAAKLFYEGKSQKQFQW